jgi:alkylhydroperoxidase/carboxymuconolactone decarboxylase family protein YurZ
MTIDFPSRTSPMAVTEETLRRLALSDDRLLKEILSGHGDATGRGCLDARTTALVRLAALVAMGGSTTSFAATASSALIGGATIDDLVDTLLAVAPIVGSANVVCAAPKLAVSVGYDIDRSFEDPDLS